MYKQLVLILLSAAIACCLLVLGGCENDGKSVVSWPAANISGTWSGNFSTGGDTGSGTAINFLFMQTGPDITGNASFLGRINGTLHGRTLNIEGTDLVGYLADDFATIRGTFTAADGTQALFTITKDEGAATPLAAPPSSGGGSGSGDSGDGSVPGPGDEGWPPPGWEDWEMPPTPPMP